MTLRRWREAKEPFTNGKNLGVSPNWNVGIMPFPGQIQKPQKTAILSVGLGYRKPETLVK